MKSKLSAKTSGNKGVNGLITAAAAILFLLFTTSAQAAGPQRLHGHVPGAVGHLQPLGRFANTNRLSLAIGLPLRNQQALDSLLQEIYDPASPNFHHYLTPEQFAERFGPTEQDYQAVIAFAKANGLTVIGTHPNRLLVDVKGSVADIEKALHVTMRVYQHPNEDRTFYAPDVEPSINLSVPVLRIGGLDNYSLPRPGSVTTPNAGSGPSGTFMGNDFRAAYLPDSSLTGSGQVVGLLQFDGYTASDITYYESQAGLPNVTLSNVLINGATGNPSHSGGEIEVSLDIEMAISMAPGLSEVMVYMAPNPTPWETILSRMANDNAAKQLSCSWYQPGGTANTNADNIFKQMEAQGQSFFSASGDYDAFTGLIPFPCDNPYITIVGGTTLSTTGPGGPWTSETVWNWGVEYGRDGIGSGGGISTQYPIPSYQMNIDMTTNHGSTTMRNIPDVALTADNVYVRANGADYNEGGTSCAAPLWAGFTALINQQAAAIGQSPIGFINPTIYSLGAQPFYAYCFHDITTGNNTWRGSPTNFYAVPGYDLCTGWGTPAGQDLINVLAPAGGLIVVPAAGLDFFIPVGEPPGVTGNVFLMNGGTTQLSWSLANESSWLDASPAAGTLEPGEIATVTTGPNAEASNLPVGTYSTTVWFTNLNNGVGQGCQFTLTVMNPPTITTQPNSQTVHPGATVTFTVAAIGTAPLSYQWQYSADGTTWTEIVGATSATLTLIDAQAGNAGYYSAVVSNPAASASSASATLTLVGPPPPVITVQPTSQTVYEGDLVTFSVTATTTNIYPITYQWWFNGAAIVGATSPTLTLNYALPNNVGSYCVVVSCAGSSTNSVTVTLTENSRGYVVLFGPQSNYTFQGDTTYYIVGAVNLYGTNTFEGGAVIKYATNASIVLQSTNLNWQASSYRPVIFTAKDDNSVGAAISGSTGSPSGYYANPALKFFNASSTRAPLSNFRIAYAEQALTSGTAGNFKFYDCQIVNCHNGITFNSAGNYFRNALFSRVGTVFNNGFYGGIDLQNCTIESSFYLATVTSGTVGANLNNCIFANVTNLFSGSLLGYTASYNGFYKSPTIGTSAVTNTFYPFQNVGAGSYYLANGCNFFNAGTMNIDSMLLADLKEKTTYPPVVYSNVTLSANTTWSPQALRDTDTPDLGYHYDPLDYLVGGVNISASLTLTNGVAVGLMGPAAVTFQPSLTLQPGGNLYSQGTATNLNHLANYANVQEQPVSLGYGSLTESGTSLNNKAIFSFTDVSMDAGIYTPTFPVVPPTRPTAPQIPSGAVSCMAVILFWWIMAGPKALLSPIICSTAVVGHRPARMICLSPFITTCSEAAFSP